MILRNVCVCVGGGGGVLTLLELKVQILSISSVFKKDSSCQHQHYQRHRHCTGGYCDANNLALMRFVHCSITRVGRLQIFFNK